jgi:hypothetical protein
VTVEEKETGVPRGAEAGAVAVQTTEQVGLSVTVTVPDCVQGTPSTVAVIVQL